jgi:hypothetical protein
MSAGVVSAKDKLNKFNVAGADVSTVVSFVCIVTAVISDATVTEVMSPLLTCTVVVSAGIIY